MGDIATLVRTLFDRSGGGMLARLVGAPLLGVILGMLGRGGGLGALLEKFRGAGLADKAASWVGTGPNSPLNAGEVERALGPEEIQRAAARTGMSADEVREGLAAGLPEVIDHLTPRGGVPDADQLGEMIRKLSRYLPR